MKLVLNIYKDEPLKQIERKAEADRYKIPYRVSIYLLELLESENIESDVDLIRLMVSSPDKLDKVIKATFELKDSELECIDSAELLGVVIELYKWIVEKTNALKESSSKSANSSGEVLTLPQMIFDINKDLCSTYPALDPIRLLDYPAEDVFNLITGTVDYGRRQSGKKGKTHNSGVIRRQAADNWF